MDKTVRLCHENTISRYYSPFVEEISKMPHRLIQHEGEGWQNTAGPSRVPFVIPPEPFGSRWGVLSAQARI